MPRFSDYFPGYFPSFAFNATHGTNPRTDPDRWGANEINALDFGNTFDDVQIQAAIDAAFNLDISRVRIPYIRGGLWTLNNPVFQDPPGNLRGSLTKAQLLAGQTAAPTNHGPYISVEADWRTRFTANFNTAPAWWIGTGSGDAAGHHTKGVNITNSTGAGLRPKTLPINCTGFAISSGGSVGAVFEACSANNFYSGWTTGQNGAVAGDSLAEGNKWLYCATSNCYNGIWWQNLQALVNTIFHCNIGASRNFRSQGQDYIVLGGEHGQSQSARAAVTISGTSTLSPFTDKVPGGATFTNFTFTTTIAAPDANWNACPDGGFVYGVATIKLPGFGVVPLRLIAFNSGTNVATFQIESGWTWMYYNQEVALDSGTDFNTQLQAATTLYAVEQCSYFEGPGHLIHCHYENNSLTSLWDAPGNFSGGVYTPQTTMSGGGAIADEMLVNNDPSLANFSGSSGADLGLFYAAQAFAWVRQVGINFTMRETGVPSGLTGQHLIVEGYDSGNDTTTLQMVFERCRGLASPNLRYVGNNGSSYIPAGPGYDNSLTTRGNFGSKAFGFGEWDRTYWGPNVNAATPDSLSYAPRAGGTSTTKYIGFKPAPGELQRVTTADLTAIASPAGPGLQQMICARSMCVIEQTGSQTHALAKDQNGDGFSYYSDLTVNWSYDGQTHLLTITGGTHANWLFPGLEIGLDNGGGVVYYIVTGTYPALGYVTVYRESTTLSVLAGTKGVTYTGSTIKQRTASLLQI